MSNALAEGELQTVNLPCDFTICASSSVPFPRAVAAKRAGPRSRGAPHSTLLSSISASHGLSSRPRHNIVKRLLYHPQPRVVSLVSVWRPRTGAEMGRNRLDYIVSTPSSLAPEAPWRSRWRRFQHPKTGASFGASTNPPTCSGFRSPREGLSTRCIYPSTHVPQDTPMRDIRLGVVYKIAGTGDLRPPYRI